MRVRTAEKRGAISDVLPSFLRLPACLPVAHAWRCLLSRMHGLSFQEEQARAMAEASNGPVVGPELF